MKKLRQDSVCTQIVVSNSRYSHNAVIIKSKRN